MRAINATVMRQVNRTLILNHIRMRPISRAELAEETGLTRASVTQIVEELISEGIVVETSVIGRSRLGRRSTQLAIDSRAGTIFGVSLDRTQCAIGAINMRGEVLRQNVELISGRTAPEALDSIAEIIRKQQVALGIDPARIYGVGVSVPGPVTAGGVLIHESSVWQNVPLAEMLAKRTGMPVWLETAANAQALDEQYFGAFSDNFILIRVSESISAGVVVRGQLYRGAPDFVVQLGSCPADSEQNRSLDQLISIPALLRGTPWRTWDELMQRAGEPEAEQIADRMVAQLASAIINLIHAFSIDRVLLAGELSRASALLLAKLNREVRAGIRCPIPHAPVSAASPTNPIRVSAAPAYDSFFKTEF